MTRRALQSLDAYQARLSAGNTLRTLGALVLEDALLPLGVSAWRAVVLILRVDDFGAHDGTPLTLRAGVPVVATLGTHVAWLAATAVSDLTLCCFYAHCLEWAASRRS